MDSEHTDPQLRAALLHVEHEIEEALTLDVNAGLTDIKNRALQSTDAEPVDRVASARSLSAISSAVTSPRAGAFEEFYRDEYRMLIKVALTAGATMDEAEDACSQTMLEMWRRWEGIENRHAYARKAVVSNFVKQRKRDRRRANLMLKGGHVTLEGDVDAQLVVWEDDQWVEQMLSGLPPAQQNVMRYVLESLSTMEIAELLGKTSAAVRKNLELARKRLRAQLGKEYEIESRGQAGGGSEQDHYGQTPLPQEEDWLSTAEVLAEVTNLIEAVAQISNADVEARLSRSMR